VVTKVKVVDNIPRLCLYAKKFIRPGEELTFDYGDRTPFSISANPWLKF
jgi:histone-lysine N-methyltransferase SETD8